MRTSVDRTAVWVGDRITYTITLLCGRGVGILVDDLSKDKLRVEGLEIAGSDLVERTTDRSDRTTYVFHYGLTTYRVDVPELRIAPMTVRYYLKTPGQRLEDPSPAGEVAVPPTVIAWRSALPDGQEQYAIRAGREARPRRLRYAMLQRVGIGLVIVAIVPTALSVAAAVRRGRPRQARRSVRQVSHEERASLEALHAIDLSTLAGRRDAYSRLNALVRDHLRQVAGIDAASLTPKEIERAMSSRGGEVPLEVVMAVLTACDQARYAPLEAVPSSEACRQTIEHAQQVLGT